MAVEFCTLLARPVSSATPPLQADARRHRMRASIASAARDHLNFPGSISRMGLKIAARTPNIPDITSSKSFLVPSRISFLLRKVPKTDCISEVWGFRLPRLPESRSGCVEQCCRYRQKHSWQPHPPVRNHHVISSERYHQAAPAYIRLIDP